MNLAQSAILSFCISGGMFAQQSEKALPTDNTSANAVETNTATVEKVFKIEDDGFQYIAYQITYHGKQVIVEDPTCISNYSIGERLRFIVCRNDMTKSHSNGKKLIAFIVHKAKA